MSIATKRAGLGVATAFVGAVAVLAASAVAGSKAPVVHRPVPFERGVSVGEWGPTAYDKGRTRDTLARLAKDEPVRPGTLFMNWGQQDGSSTTIAPGSETVSTDRLVDAIRAAKKLGLEVILRPYVEPLDGSWRG